jgi:hypothetical protein
MVMCECQHKKPWGQNIGYFGCFTGYLDLVNKKTVTVSYTKSSERSFSRRPHKIKVSDRQPKTYKITVRCGSRFLSIKLAVNSRALYTPC